MDPLNSRIVARHIADVFCGLDAANCADYRTRLATFEGRLEAAMKEWTEALLPFRGAQIVTFHTTWRYFALRFNLKSEMFLEPKPGIPPSPPHLAEVITRMNAERIRIILVEPYQSLRTAEAVASRTGASLVKVAQFPGGLPNTDDDYLALMDANVRALTTALAAAK
jgi:ABC-type Zn uptake system ZnuABC Zn-binding protein ZnuA